MIDIGFPSNPLVSNLLAYSAQVAAIVALGTALYYLLRIDVPRLRHAYWQGLLALCLCLPLLQPWRTPAMEVATPTVAAAAPAGVTLNVSLRTGRVTSNEAIDWPRITVQVLAAGAVLRLPWTAIGLWRLRGLRRLGVPAEFSEHADLKAAVGAIAEIRYVRSIDQPVTFGLWRPMVILPDALRDYPVDVQRAVVCHELCHVRRRDWAWLLLEEGVRAALWFHPALWWVISRIQLTREEAVDAAVIGTTGQRRVYAEALMAFADAAPLTPAAAFSRRRHLVTRILLISKEAVMSSRRIVASCAVMVASVAAGSWYAVQAFPLQGGVGAIPTAPLPGQRVPARVPLNLVGPLEQKAKPVTPENPIPRRLSTVPVELPAGASHDLKATVSLRATLDQHGRVAEVRGTRAAGVPSAILPDALAAAIDAVKQWQYEPPADAPVSFGVTVLFDGTGTPTARQETGIPFVIAASGRGGAASFAGEPTQAAFPGTVAPPAPGAPVRVGGAVSAPVKTVHVNPVYPPIAQSARVQGVVILETVIDESGNVREARILRSIPLLDQAALDAVRQWQFTPTLLNGQPTPLVMTVTVQFSLPEVDLPVQ